MQWTIDQHCDLCTRGRNERWGPFGNECLELWVLLERIIECHDYTLVDCEIIKCCGESMGWFWKRNAWSCEMLTPWPSLKLLLYPSQNLVWEMHPMEMCQLVDHCQTLGGGAASLSTRWGEPEYDPLAWQGGVRQHVFEWQVGVNILKPHCFMLFISFWYHFCCYFVHKFGALTFPSAYGILCFKLPIWSDFVLIRSFLSGYSNLEAMFKRIMGFRIWIYVASVFELSEIQ